MISKYLQRKISTALTDSRRQVWYIICSTDFGNIEEYISDTLGRISEAYLRYRKGNKNSISAKASERYKEELEEAAAWFRENVMEYYFRKKKERELALIQYPLLSHKVAETMRKKGLRYKFTTDRFENILTIPIEKYSFLYIPLTLDNCEQMLDLIDYFRARPECIKKEHPEIKVRGNYWLAQAWKQVASDGSE